MFSLQWILDTFFGQQTKQTNIILMIGSSSRMPTHQENFMNPQDSKEIIQSLKEDYQLFKYKFRNYNCHYIQSNSYKNTLLSKSYIVNWLKSQFNQNRTNVFLFYSGDGHQNGDWAIQTQQNPQGDRLSLDQLLAIWDQRQMPKDENKSHLNIFMNSHYASHWCYRLGSKKDKMVTDFNIFTAQQRKQQFGLRRRNKLFKCILGSQDKFEQNYKQLNKHFIPIFIKNSKIVAKLYKNQLQLLRNDIFVATKLQSDTFLDVCRGHGSSLVIKVNRNYQNGQKYIGQLKNNTIKHGKGICYYQDGRKYDGFYFQGQKSGKGTFYWVDGDTYQGNWSRDKQNGFGKFTWGCGDTYEGDWKDNLFHGGGTYKWKDGRMYEGDYVMGQQQGKGKMIWQDGQCYQGSWKNDMYDGQGIFNWEDGRIYKGQFKQDKKHGKGIYIFPDGDSFSGTWKEDKLHGVVTYKTADGKKQVRQYKNGKLIESN